MNWKTGMHNNVLELEEWDAGSLRRIDEQYDILSLSNRNKVDIDEKTLADLPIRSN